MKLPKKVFIIGEVECIRYAEIRALPASSKRKIYEKGKFFDLAYLARNASATCLFIFPGDKRSGTKKLNSPDMHRFEVERDSLKLFATIRAIQYRDQDGQTLKHTFADQPTDMYWNKLHFSVAGIRHRSKSQKIYDDERGII